MPFATTTLDRVMGVLGLPVVAPFWVQHVEDALNRAQNYGGEAAVSRIEGYLTKYESAETSLSSNASRQGLIRADVLEWAPGGQSAGFQAQMSTYRDRILTSLFLPHEQAEIKRMMNSGSTLRIRR